ncbi:Type II secretion system protein J precursor [Marinomonas aquimarina]|uniref:Type II secretion system protein J n=1 Tax=Marinomonas aquimarina TaxID=295068 RepID=A0A1A8TIW6_9GAMM|nr:type II secretion system minor pseudopilin GspJ [Marinomonas aquimarina]SBS32440.1 Type II secretion system protein J precursor [Marinomonas aquimarina]
MACNRLLVSSRQQQGFTLVELLVVVLIMAIMGAAAYDMLGTSMRLESRTAEHSHALERLTKAVYWLQQDSEQYIDRPIRDVLGESEPSLLLNSGELSLTHLGWSNPLQERRATLQRVHYQVSNGELQRLSWRVLDRAQDSAPIRQVLLDSVQGLEFAILANGAWHGQWPLAASSLPGGESSAAAQALRVRLTIAPFGTIERIFELPSTGKEGAL